jgi:hypothetical protein
MKKRRTRGTSFEESQAHDIGLEERLGALIGHWDYQRSPVEIVALGPFALQRLLDAKDQKGTLWHEGVDPRDYEDALHEAIAAFGEHDPDRVLSEMRKRGWNDRRIVLSGLGRVADAHIASMLIDMYSSKDPLDRLQAIGYMGAQHDPRAVWTLVHALSDRSVSVRLAVIKSLGETGNSNMIEALQDVLKRNVHTPSIAAAARATIAKIRTSLRKRRKDIGSKAR